MTILLVGIDFSTRSDRALRRAVLLAREANFEILIVSVIENGTSAVSDDERQREASTILRRMQRTIIDFDGVDCRMEVRVGEPSEQLAEAAQDAGVDLVVIGAHRQGLIRDAFGAVTAERIVRHSRTPLIASNAIPSGPYRRLLLPVDLGDASRQAVEALQKLEFGNNAEIVLLHIYEPEARAMLGRAMATQEIKTDYLAERAALAEMDLKKFAVSVGLERATQLVAPSSGPMVEDIERFAAEDGSNLIIVSRSQKGFIGKSLLGSVTEDLLRFGKLDILVIPPS